MSERWTPTSWRDKPIQQVPSYPDRDAAEGRRGAARQLSAAGFCRRGAQAQEGAGRGRRRRGLPAAGRRLRRELRRALAPTTSATSSALFLQMAVVLTFAGASPVVKVGRVAGQFAKPRSAPTRDASAASSCRATAATSSTASSSRPKPRIPDPRRQLEAYRQSAATLNLLRAFATGGYANLENAHRWMLGFVKDSPQSAPLPGARRPHHRDAGLHARHRASTPETHPEMRATDFYTSHEALLLGYEQALTRVDSTVGRLVRHLGPHALDRRPHAPARPRPCRISAAASRTRSA